MTDGSNKLVDQTETLPSSLDFKKVPSQTKGAWEQKLQMPLNKSVDGQRRR